MNWLRTHAPYLLVGVSFAFLHALFFWETLQERGWDGVPIVAAQTLLVAGLFWMLARTLWRKS